MIDNLLFDNIGIYNYFALKSISLSKGSAKKLFFSFYFLSR